MEIDTFVDIRPPISSWDEMAGLQLELAAQKSDHGYPRQWAFRGQWDAAQEPEITLRRVAARWKGDPYELESKLLRTFKRHYHLYSTDAPANDDYLEWLGVMRHFRAPTRLLDWSYSFWVGVYFALRTEEARTGRPPETHAVWALDLSEDWFVGQVREIFGSDPTTASILGKDGDIDVRKGSTFKALFRQRHGKHFIYPVNPFRMNQRMLTQQGVFLCPADLRHSFMENLAGILERTEPREVKGRRLVKILIRHDPEQRARMLLQLHRMNINDATLFPGLEGFAQSLEVRAAFPWTMKEEPGF